MDRNAHKTQSDSGIYGLYKYQNNFNYLFKTHFEYEDQIFFEEREFN